MTRRHDVEGRERREAGNTDVSSLRGQVLSYLEERFGLPSSLFSGYGLYLGSKGRIYLGPKGVPPGLRIAVIGLTVARADGGMKPTTNLLQAFGKQVTRNTISLEREDALRFLKGEDLAVAGSGAGNATDGYVLVKYLDCPLGCALLKSGMLKNMLPKAKRLDVKYI